MDYHVRQAAFCRRMEQEARRLAANTSANDPALRDRRLERADTFRRFALIYDAGREPGENDYDD
jgi:hypothetical protein